MKSAEVIKSLSTVANIKKAKILSSFFKTGKGQYGEGDIFIGVVVPEQRKIANKYIELTLPEVQKILQSKIHEHRLTALLILVAKFNTLWTPGVHNIKRHKEIFDFYINNSKYINNWDLVDLSAPNIVGKYLSDKNRNVLYKLAISKNLWERRIAILSTFYFIKINDFTDTLKISKILLSDKHDLIHKAVGWMLREVGKRDEKVLTDFLTNHINVLPRTTLRYAIERFTQSKRQKFLSSSRS